MTHGAERPSGRGAIEPILDRDLDAVGTFLHEHMNGRIAARDWTRSLRTGWSGSFPNHGFMLKSGDGRIAGVYAAIYSERTIRGVMQRFCNLAAWCVLPLHRLHSFFLLQKLLAQEGYHFTDLTPNDDVVGIMTRMKFERLDTTWVVMPNLPWWTGSGKRLITTDLAEISRSLTVEHARAFEDHRDIGSVRHILVRGEEPCHVMFHRHKRRGVPCITILHASAPRTLATRYRALASHFLFAERALLTIFEARTLASAPRLAFRTASPHAKMFRSATLRPEEIDNLYSEVVTLALPSTP